MPAAFNQSSVPRNPRLKKTFGYNELLYREFGISRLYRWLAAFGYSILAIIVGGMFYASWEILINSRSLSDGSGVIILHAEPLLAAAGVTALMILAVWLYFLWYLRISRVYALTDQRLIIHVGWLGARYISINYEELTDVKVNIGIIERFLFGTGKISLNTAGADGFEVIIRHIDAPYTIKREIIAMIEEG